MNEKCECGIVQDNTHICECSNFEGTSKKDVDEFNDNAIKLAAYWIDKINQKTVTGLEVKEGNTIYFKINHDTLY